MFSEIAKPFQILYKESATPNATFINLKNALEASFECEMRNSHVHISDCFVMNKI